VLACVVLWGALFVFVWSAQVVGQPHQQATSMSWSTL
jgi:hypothetical protein